MAISDSQKKAVDTYKKKNYDRVELSIPKGKKAELKIHAERLDESLNGFINRAILETVERDKKKELVK